VAQERGAEQRSRITRAGGRFQRAPAAQHGKACLGDERAILLPEIAMAAEVLRQHLVGRRRKAQQLSQRRLGMAEERGGYSHWVILVATWSKRSPFFSTTRSRTGMYLCGTDSHSSALSFGSLLRATLTASNSPAGTLMRSRPTTV